MLGILLGFLVLPLFIIPFHPKYQAWSERQLRELKAKKAQQAAPPTTLIPASNGTTVIVSHGIAVAQVWREGEEWVVTDMSGFEMLRGTSMDGVVASFLESQKREHPRAS